MLSFESRSAGKCSTWLVLPASVTPVSGLSPGPNSLKRTATGGCSVARWAIVVGVGILLSQLFALGHLVLFAHELCEHGALVHAQSHGWQREARPEAPTDSGLSIASGGGSNAEHDHCDPFAAPPAVASVIPAFGRARLLDELVPLGPRAREATQSVAILALAPKTSPTA